MNGFKLEPALETKNNSFKSIQTKSNEENLVLKSMLKVLTSILIIIVEKWNLASLTTVKNVRTFRPTCL